MSKPNGASSGKAKRKLSQKPLVQKVQAPDPLSKDAIRQMALRLGLPLLAAWVIGICVAGVSQSKTTQIVALVLPFVLTLGIGGGVLLAGGRAKKGKSRGRLWSEGEQAQGMTNAGAPMDSG